jgi:hypothetical protein
MLLLKVLVILKINLVVQLLLKILIFGDAPLKFGNELINLVMNKK